MEIKVSNNLIKLAKAFQKENATLYIVGGYIRNAKFNLLSYDIDICSSLVPDKVMAICETLKFKATLVNKKLGTILIQTKTEKFEYTCFRTENYPKSGAHSPDSTKFVEDIKLDAGRRDFTINALYYNILTGETLDFYNGEHDIKKKVLKAIKTPKEVFESDGLRLLRLIRFALTYGLAIDKETLLTAKNYNYQLKDISKERIIKELKEIVVADLIYNLSSKHTYETLLNKLDLYQYIFNSNFKNFKLKKVYDKKHIDKEQRYIYFGTQILKNIFERTIATKEQIEYQIHKTFGENGLKDSNEVKNQLLSIYYIYQYNFNLKTITKEKSKLLDILVAFNKLSNFEQTFIQNCSTNLYFILTEKSKEFEDKNIPLSQDKLNISNKKLIDIGINPKLISTIKNKLFVLCLNEKIKNNENDLIDIAKELNNNPGYYSI